MIRSGYYIFLLKKSSQIWPYPILARPSSARLLELQPLLINPSKKKKKISRVLEINNGVKPSMTLKRLEPLTIDSGRPRNLV